MPGSCGDNAPMLSVPGTLVALRSPPARWRVACWWHRFILAAVTLLLVACQASSHGAAPASGSLRIATWNLQWLLNPADSAALIRNCVPEGVSPGTRRRHLPCSAIAAADRSSDDLNALAVYAGRLNADVVALQEVDGAVVAARLFPGYEFCFTRSAGVQNNGFAIRRGLRHRCGADVSALSLDGRLRRGAELILYPDTPDEIRLLGVHLKSGCSRRTLDNPRDACQTLARQVPELERWIDAQAAARRPFVVLGDFNRQLLEESGPARNDAGALRSLWAEIDDADPPEADLTDAAAGERFENCTPFQRFTGYIDHILLSRTLAARRRPDGFGRVTFDAGDASRRKLSDHCPVWVDLLRPN